MMIQAGFSVLVPPTAHFCIILKWLLSAGRDCMEARTHFSFLGGGGVGLEPSCYPHSHIQKICPNKAGFLMPCAAEKEALSVKDGALLCCHECSLSIFRLFCLSQLLSNSSSCRLPADLPELVRDPCWQ